MSDELDQLSDDYYDYRLRTAPTWAHMIGEYRYADRFDAIGRAAEEQAAADARELAGRADAIAEDGLDDQQRITRAMVAWEATARADILESRTAEFAANPIFGTQASLGVYMPKLAIPDADVAEAMVGKFESVARYFDDIAERHREGVTSGRTPADFAVRQTVDQLDAWLAKPIQDDPMLTVQDPPGDNTLPGNNLGTIPLPGLSKNVWNATLYYEKAGFSARVAMRARSKYIGEVTNFANERAFKYVKGDQITDAQLGYEFSEGRLDGVSVLFQVNNLTNEPYIAYAVSETRQQDFQQYGRQFLLGINYRL